MTERERLLMRELINELRTEIGMAQDFQDADWKDIDDYAFSHLSLTKGELLEIFPDLQELISFDSAIQTCMPKSPSYYEVVELQKELEAANAELFCCETETVYGKIACLRVRYSNGYLGRIVLTEADEEALKDAIGEIAILDVPTLDETPADEIPKARILIPTFGVAYEAPMRRRWMRCQKHAS